MTFTELVDEVLARTRQTSAEARDRIGRAINDRHRRVTSSLGLETSRRSEASIVLLGGPPSLATPPPPVVTDVGSGTFGGTRIYQVRWVGLANLDLTVAHSEPSTPAVFFVPSGTGAGARLARPSPPPATGATHWTVEAWAFNGHMYRLAYVNLGELTYDDTLPIAGIPTYGTLVGRVAAVTPVMKVMAVTDAARQRVLQEVTFDEWRTRSTTSPAAGPPEVYAVDTIQANNVVLRFHPWPATDYWLTVDGLSVVSTLTGSLSPLFSTDFHDLLLHGALSDEWMQLKQDDLSRRSETMYEQRLAELRLFIAKSAYLDIYQGKTGVAAGGAYWPGYRYRGRY